MLTKNERVVWEKRWKALDERLKALANTCGKSAFSRKDTLCNLVKRLQKFAKGQFEFFLNGFSECGNLQESQDYANGFSECGYLKETKDYPPQYALGVTLDQIALDLEVIERAVHQRQHPDIASTLNRADRLAWKALEPAVKDNLLNDNETTVITYFQKSASIRVIPYAPVALIGIPFSVTDVPRDYLAIPHEVGHYVYRHGQINGGTPIPRALREKVNPSPIYIKNWSEEIFADVYGCLIGGPVMALDFQDLQLEGSAKQFVRDDEEHPVPFVRPYIYTHVLEEIDFENSSDKLNSHWEERLENERGNPQDFRRSTNSGNTTLDTARAGVNTVIDRIISDLPNPSKKWSDDLGQSEDVNKLYDDFTETHIESLISDVTLRGLTSEAFDYDEWRNSFFPDGFKTAPRIPPGKTTDIGNAPNGTWLQVLDADGWATRGPQTSGD